MTELLPPNTFPEFYSFQRFRFDWHLIFYPHGNKDYFGSAKESAHHAREGKVRDFLNRLQRRLGLRQKEMLFFASTEFGDGGTGHIHALISFDGLRQKKNFDKIESSNALMNYSIARIREEMFRSSSRKIDCIPVNSSEKDQRDVLAYVCKKEFGHDYKHCFFSSWLLRGTTLQNPCFLDFSSSF